MNVQNIEKKENNTASFQATVEAADFEKAVNEVYKRNKKDLYIPGFRKGKAPRAVIEGMYGKQIFFEEAVEDLADPTFQAALAETGLRMVGRPSIENVDISDDKVLTYTFNITLYPEVQLGEYKGIEVEADDSEFDESVLEKELEEVRKRNARLIDVERAAQNGDRVTIDFEGFVDDVAFEGGKGEDYDLELGSGTFIPGFEEQLIGAAAGEVRDVNVTFPEEYTPELAGKAAVFKVVVKGVQEQELPELDDELAKDISDFDTMDEYKADLREKLVKNFEDEKEGSFATRLMEAAIDKMEVEIPEVMVEEKLEEQLRNYASSMGMMPMDMTKEEILKAMSIDENTFSTVMRPQAMFELNTELLLDAVAKTEEITSTEEEVEEAIADMAKNYNMEPDQIRQFVNVDVVRTDLARRKAAQVIRDNAVKKAPEAPAEEEKSAE